MTACAAVGRPPKWRTVDPIGLVTVRDQGYLPATRSGEDRTYGCPGAWWQLAKNAEALAPPWLRAPPCAAAIAIRYEESIPWGDAVPGES
jgi:hypothetical protein